MVSGCSRHSSWRKSLNYELLKSILHSQSESQINVAVFRFTEDSKGISENKTVLKSDVRKSLEDLEIQFSVIRRVATVCMHQRQKVPLC